MFLIIRKGKCHHLKLWKNMECIVKEHHEIKFALINSLGNIMQMTVWIV